MALVIGTAHRRVRSSAPVICPPTTRDLVSMIAVVVTAAVAAMRLRPQGGL